MSSVRLLRATASALLPFAPAVQVDAHSASQFAKRPNIVRMLTDNAGYGDIDS